MLHPRPCWYGKGDTDTVAHGSNPEAWYAFGVAEPTTGQDQGCCLADPVPVACHELDPVDDRSEGRVHLVDFNPTAGYPGTGNKPEPRRN